MHRNIKHIGLFLLLLLALPVSAKKVQPLSVEQEQQFTYYWYAARQAITDERYADAYVLLEFCNELKPNDGQTLYFLGIIYQALKQEDKAYATFEKAYAAQKKGKVNEELLDRLKMLYINRQEWSKALKMQDEIDAQNSYDGYSAITRYRIYAMWNKPKKAIQEIDKYLKIDPTNLRFLLFRLELMEQTGAKKKDLYAMYDKVLELDPYNLMVLNNYAYLRAVNGDDLKRAERMSEQTIREQPSNPVYLDTYGWILHLQGEDELAKFYLYRALQNAGNNENVIQEIKKHFDAIK